MEFPEMKITPSIHSTMLQILKLMATERFNALIKKPTLSKVVSTLYPAHRIYAEAAFRKFFTFFMPTFYFI
jgi:hypothetical protein